MNLDCPQCGKDDRVEKVTGVTKVQTLYGDFHGMFAASGGINLRSHTRPAVQPWEYGDITSSHGVIGFSGQVDSSGVTESGLAQRLAPPSKPTLSLPPQPRPSKETRSTGAAYFSLTMILILLLWGGGLAFVGFAKGNAGLGVVGSLCVTAGIAWVVAMVVNNNNIDSRNLAEWSRTCDLRRQECARNLSRWEPAAMMWDRLFYCFRCDSAFLPDGLSQPIRPELVSRFVFDPSSARAVGARDLGLPPTP